MLIYVFNSHQDILFLYQFISSIVKPLSESDQLIYPSVILTFDKIYR